jgi:hypothetical protein
LAAQPAAAHRVRHLRPPVIPTAEVIVGRPRDGIVELPETSAKVPR